MLPMQDLPHVFARIALANGQDVCFTNNDGENVNKRIDSYFPIFPYLYSFFLYSICARK